MKRGEKGFTLFETVIALGMFGLFLGATMLMLGQVLQTIGESRVRTTALALAQEKMETIRNLSYANVGTVGGIPPGSLLASETITINILPFSVTTSIVYIDDPFDGVAPADLVNSDYKRARVEITWGGVFRSRFPVTLVSNIAPKGIETTGSGGTLFLNVFDSNGQPVPQSIVTIDNTTVIPEIHTQTLSDTSGLVVLPGTPPCVSCYQLSVTKQGYSTDKTYSSSEVANPLLPHATVITSEITQLSFAIDKLSQITINSYGSKESGYPVVANVLFTLRGSKVIGYDTGDNPVYKYKNSTTTGGGSISIPNVEWDTYTIDLSDSEHNLAGSNPVSPLGLPAASSQIVSIVAVPKTAHSLLVITKSGGGELLANTSVNIKNIPLSIDITKFTTATGAADFGQVFFGGLASNTYDLIASLSAYQDATSSVTIVGATSETMLLTPL